MSAMTCFFGGSFRYMVANLVSGEILLAVLRAATTVAISSLLSGRVNELEPVVWDEGQVMSSLQIAKRGRQKEKSQRETASRVIARLSGLRIATSFRSVLLYRCVARVHRVAELPA